MTPAVHPPSCPLWLSVQTRAVSHNLQHNRTVNESTIELVHLKIIELVHLKINEWIHLKIIELVHLKINEWIHQSELDYLFKDKLLTSLSLSK